jgi:hypothetical protein
MGTIIDPMGGIDSRINLWFNKSYGSLSWEVAMTDCYEILGVSPQASREEIQRKYRELVLHYHPDRHPHDPDAAERFKMIEEAYELLDRPDRRPALGTFHTPWSLFLTTRVFSKSPRREYIMASNNLFLPLSVFATLIFIGLIAGILAISCSGGKSAADSAPNAEDSLLAGLLSKIPLLDDLVSPRFLIAALFMTAFVVYVIVLFLIYGISSRYR